MTTAPMASENVSGATAPSARPAEARTKLNSPLWPIRAPARSAFDGRLAVQHRQAGDRQRLAEGDDQEERQHHRPGGEDGRRLQQDPDRDEEEGAEQLAQRHDLTQHAGGQVGIGKRKAGDEGAERHAHPERAGREGGADGDDGDGDDEQLARAQACDEPKQPREHPRAAEQDQGDESERHDDGADEPQPGLVGLAAERREADDQHHRQEVLDDRDAERRPSVGGRVQRRFASHLHEHHGRGHRDGTADEQRRQQLPAQGKAGRRADGHRQGNLDRDAGEDASADGAKLTEAELETDAEHQERDADVGERQHLLAIGDEARREWTDRHAGGDVAEHRRQPEPMRKRAEHQRRHQGDEQCEPQAGHLMDRQSAARSVVGGMARSYRPISERPLPDGSERGRVAR